MLLRNKISDQNYKEISIKCKWLIIILLNFYEIIKTSNLCLVEKNLNN